MKITDKVIHLHDDSLNSLGELPKQGVNKKKKKSKADIILNDDVSEAEKMPDTKTLLKHVAKSKDILSTFNKNIADDTLAHKLIVDMLLAMSSDIEQAEAGERSGIQVINPESGKGYLKNINISKKSTFPDWFRDVYDSKGTKVKFYSNLRGGRSKQWEKILNVAMERLTYGYKTPYDYDMPNNQFNLIVSTGAPF